jgi:hypothetical protein
MTNNFMRAPRLSRPDLKALIAAHAFSIAIFRMKKA